MTATVPTRPASVIPLALFAMPLGVVGLAGAWSFAAAHAALPSWPAEALYVGAALLWVVYTVVWLVELGRGRRALRDDLRHASTGPFAGYPPVVGILLAAHLASFAPVAGLVLCVVFVSILAIVEAVLVQGWISGGLDRERLHMGYFLPVVAGSFIASIGLSVVRLHDAAIAAFGVGVFYYAILGAIVVSRLVTGAPLPLALRPSLSILLAAPATGGTAWFELHGDRHDLVQTMFLGIVVMMALVQVLLIRMYRHVPFSMGYWTFGFPVASTCAYLVRWILDERPVGWEAWLGIALGLATAWIVALAIATLVHVLRGRVESHRLVRAHR